MTTQISAPRIVEDMPEAEYHARPELSKHDMDMVRRAPLLYQHKKMHPEPPDDEMNFGSLVHLALLQPHLLEASVCYVPKSAPKRPTKAQLAAKKKSAKALISIEWWKNWNDENAGKFNVTAATMDKVSGIQKSIMANPSTAIYFEGEQLREASLFWERYGVACRARLDILRTCEVVDLKTCGDASRGGFMKDMAKRRYPHQGEHYIDGAKACGYPIQAFTMIAVETNAPYLCAAHQLGESSIDIAKDENRRDILTFKKCLDSGEWPNIKNNFQPLEAPIWGFDQ